MCPALLFAGRDPRWATRLRPDHARLEPCLASVRAKAARSSACPAAGAQGSRPRLQAGVPRPWLQPSVLRTGGVGSPPDRVREASVADGKDLVRSREALEYDFPTSPDSEVPHTAQHVPHHARDQNLVRAGIPCDPCSPNHRSSEERASLSDRLSRMDPDAYVDRLLRVSLPVLAEGPLDRHRTAQSREGAREGEQETVAFEFDLESAVQRCRTAHDRIVLPDYSMGALVSQPFSHLGEPNHVAEEERDSPVGCSVPPEIRPLLLDALGDDVDGASQSRHRASLGAELLREDPLREREHPETRGRIERAVEEHDGLRPVFRISAREPELSHL